MLSESAEGLHDVIGTLLLVILILAVLGTLPTWPYSRSWTYAPSGTAGMVLVIVIALVLLGRL